jgi:DNA polymerase-3 subunit epsilon
MAATQNWAGMPCLGYDLESTGVNAHEDRIVQAAVVRIKAEQRPQITTWLTNPGVEIPEEATAVHGITTDHARVHGQDPDQVLFELTGRIALAMGHGIPVVAFNAPYDLSMLEAENRRHGIDTLASRLGGKPLGPVIDPMVLDKYVDPYRKAICANNKVPCGCGAVDKKLTSLCLHYGVQHVGAHDAAGDALAACRLWPRIIARHPEKFRGFTLAALHQAQIGWRRDQMNSLRRYFDSNGIEHDGCAPDWPIYRSPIQTANVQEALL